MIRPIVAVWIGTQAGGDVVRRKPSFDGVEHARVSAGRPSRPVDNARHGLQTHSGNPCHVDHGGATGRGIRHAVPPTTCRLGARDERGEGAAARRGGRSYGRGIAAGDGRDCGARVRRHPDPLVRPRVGECCQHRPGRGQPSRAGRQRDAALSADTAATAAPCRTRSAAAAIRPSGGGDVHPVAEVRSSALESRRQYAAGSRPAANATGFGRIIRSLTTEVE